ncbi:uncharacterized protein [Nicotiana sylvestris]|uniref:uncharacterized protein n=1 Tax=Nicotiana sylvestris TaxID=4096 RepID=UPI00388C6CF2
MLARNIVASGALRKVLNEKLKASQRKESPTQESDSSSESEAFISASEGEEHGSSNTAKIQETPSEVSSCVVLSTVVENVENRFILVGPVKDVKGAESSRTGGKKKEKEREGASGDERGNGKEKVLAICGGIEEGGNKSGGSGSGEAAEGLVHLSKQQDEPGSSVEETLVDLLKRVGASYDPKKRKASIQKAPTASKPTKESKMSSPKPTVPSVPKGRATRSRVRQSEAELQKALEESKKKRKETGKAKAVESFEVAEEEEEEMELVRQERGKTVEVPRPKPKRAKASSKKSFSEPVSDEPSLAKRTRSAVKGRLLRDLDEPGMRRLVDALAAQGWKDMVFEMDGRLARKELIEFLANATVKNGVFTSIVKGVRVQFDALKLGIFVMPTAEDMPEARIVQ